MTLLGNPSPGGRVQLVDRDGRAEILASGAMSHPAAVPPIVAEIPDNRSRTRRNLGTRGERVRLLHCVAAETGANMVFVDGADAEPCHEAFPNAGLAARPQ